MFSLGSFLSSAAIARSSALFPMTTYRFVFPRPLRKPVRFFSRLVRGYVVVPRFCFSLLSAVFFCGAISYGCHLGRHDLAIMHKILSPMGFVVQDIQISGSEKISDIEVIEWLGLQRSDFLIGLDVEALRKRFSEMAWAKNVSVRKVYPGKIQINFTEHVPFALWQFKHSLYVVSSSGEVIASGDLKDANRFPFIVGEGAAVAFADFFQILRKFPDISARVKSYVRVGNRRWNLILDDGLVIKLPERGVEDVLVFLFSENRKTSLLGRDVLSVDLRLPGRLVAQLSPGALLRFQKKPEKSHARVVAGSVEGKYELAR